MGIKISNLEELTSVSDTDILPIVSSGVTKKVQKSNLVSAQTTTTIGALINSATAATPNNTDLVATAESAGLLKKITWTNVKAFLKTYFDTLYKVTGLTAYSNLNLAEGQMINGRILPSVASDNLTVALKTLAGTDPSANDPVYVMIGGVMRSITAALSVTKNAATNWMNLGSAELATKETDLFAYLGYNATDGVVIGFSRIPFANRYDEFSATTTNEKYAGISTITNAAAGDSYVNIGRFAATLSAGAGYTWSVPTFTATNLIQRPIYETRGLTSAITFTGFSTAPTGIISYILKGNLLHIDYVDATGGISNATGFTFTTPFAIKNSISNFGPIQYKNNGSNSATVGHLQSTAGSNIVSAWTSFYQGVWTNANGKDMYWSGKVCEI